MAREFPAVEILVNKMREARGYNYTLAYSALKEHLKSLDDVSFLAEIVRVEDFTIFRYLLSAGIPYKWAQVIAKRAEELLK